MAVRNAHNAGSSRASSKRAAIVLAAGRDEESRTLLTRRLGDSAVAELALESVRKLYLPSEIYVVIAEGDTILPELLGDDLQYVVQTAPLGTGHAVACARDAVGEVNGDILITYADTPLLRPDSLRGLVNRHELKAADFSLLTAVVDQPLPYGRIERDAQYRLRGILEPSDLTALDHEIHEVNVGSYVVKGALLFPLWR